LLFRHDLCFLHPVCVHAQLRYLIYERYRSKADYLGPHKQSSAFNYFRPILKSMQVNSRCPHLGRALGSSASICMFVLERVGHMPY
jgi:hypothetical protein